MYYVLPIIYSIMPKGYKQVSLPEEFYDDIMKFIQKHPELGYTSVAEFVKVAIREKMEKHQKKHAIG